MKILNQNRIYEYLDLKCKFYILQAEYLCNELKPKIYLFPYCLVRNRLKYSKLIKKTYVSAFQVNIYSSKTILNSHSPLTIGLQTERYKDLYRREGKGRRCCLGERIDSIPCRASYFAPGRRIGWFNLKNKMISL